MRIAAGSVAVICAFCFMLFDIGVLAAALTLGRSGGLFAAIAAAAFDFRRVPPAALPAFMLHYLALGAVVWYATGLIARLRAEVHGRTVAALEVARRMGQDREQVEQALRESESMFRMLAEGAHAAIGIVQGTRFMYANSYFAEHSGYTVEELMQLEFMQLVAPEFRPMMIERAMQRQAGLPVPAHYEFKMVTKSGEKRWIDFASAAFDYRGKPAIIGTGFDITDRKEAEAALQGAKEMAEEANRAKDHFLAMLSHELRAPLTPVLTGVSLLKRAAHTGEQMQIVDTMARSVMLEARLIDDLLDLTRIAQGKIRYEMRPIDFRSVLEGAEQICHADMQGRELLVQREIAPGPYPVHGDFSRLQQVVWNLLSNAVKFTPAGGRVAIHCGREDGTLILEVRDNGVGFDPRDAARIFNAFEQAEGRQFGGLGLGLAICKRFVEAHGGQISAFSDGRGRGARFRVELPLAAPPANPVVDATMNAPSVQACCEDLHILIVEDDVDTAYFLQLALSTGKRLVKTAGDAAKALHLCAGEDFDVIISDLGLPDRPGTELLKEVRALKPGVRAIALSGFGQEEDVRKCLEAGFARHLTKPIDMETLEKVVCEAVAEPSSAA